MTSPPGRTAVLPAGARRGPYEILSPIGAGGMGEVYRARDTRLGRDVAVKVIAFDVSSDPGRLRRFEQEARTVAALNHPSILSVYDVGTEAGAPYVVFELLEGESLRQRLGHEAVPTGKAVYWAAQIARGLAAAHDRGIVHRDLKPENLFLTRDGRIKILDFGLAKLLLGEETVGEGEDSSTFSAGTSPGTLLGSVGYMSPEQVRGQAVDGRSDIFALGAVLYEMLSGRRAFRGHTSADTMTAILKEHPPELSSAQGPLPPALDHIVKRCLEKDPAERFRSAHDLAFDLERLATLSGTGAASSMPMPPARSVRGILAAVLVLGGIAFAAFHVGRRAGLVDDQRALTAPGELRFQVTLPTAVRHVSFIRLSPDGTRIAFVGIGSEGKRHLWVHSLSSLEAHPLPGTEDVRGTPFWSPDSRSIGFFTLDKLNRIDASGGPPQVLSVLPARSRFWQSGAWNKEGVVLFSPGEGYGLFRVSASGGPAVALSRLDRGRRESSHVFPGFLPDGRRFIYYAWTEDPKDRGIYLGSLDSALAQPVLITGDAATFAPPGHLLTTRGRVLLAYPLDPEHLTLGAEPSVVAEKVWSFATSTTGTLAFETSGPAISQLTWLDRGGQAMGTVGEPGVYVQMALSPDGRQIAVQRRDPQREGTDIWLIDSARRVQFGVTFDAGAEVDPVWSPDGRRLAFSAEPAGQGVMSLYQKALGGGAAEPLLRESTGRTFVEDWSRDGRFILYAAGGGGRGGLWAIPLFGDRKPFVLVAPNSFNSYDEPQLSPDGRFLAFVSTESGAYEVYVQGFPEAGVRTRISTEGGGQPRWRGDSRELFYLAPDGAMMAVDIGPAAIAEPGPLRKLFSTPLDPRPDLDQYAVSADGKRFLFLLPAHAETASPITVVLNWTAGLKK